MTYKEFSLKTGLTIEYILMILGVLFIAIVSPILVLYKIVVFDPAIFLTEYEKIICEGLVIAAILSLIGFYIEYKREVHIDKIYLKNNLSIPTEILLIELKLFIEKDEAIELPITSSTRFYWDIIISFFQNQKYAFLHDEETAQCLREVHYNFGSDSTFTIAIDYFATSRLNINKTQAKFLFDFFTKIQKCYENKT